MTTTTLCRAGARVALLSTLLAGPCVAATFVVNSQLDEVDADTGDGQCRTAAGTCTLRAAVQQANSTPGADTIVLSTTGVYALSIAPSGTANDDASGDLDVTENLSISPATIQSPANTAIDGRGIARIFRVAGGTLTLGLLTLQGGDATKETAAGDTHQGGAVLGAAVLTGCIVAQNKASDGGGLFGVTKLDRVTVSKNSTTGSGNGGGAFLGNAADIANSIFDGNAAGGSGGGLALLPTAAAEITLTDSVVKGNAAGSGGGIALLATGAILTAQSLTVSANTASAGDGGGVSVVNGSATLRNATLSGNKSEHGQGGGVDCASNGSLTLNNVTIASNTAGRSGGGLHAGASATVANTIIAGNTVTDSAHKGPDCDASVSGGHNLVQDDTDCALPDDHNTTGEDPQLGQLKDNGRYRKLEQAHPGPNGKLFELVVDCASATLEQILTCAPHLETMAISHSSLAVNGGESSTCEELDQRHAPRASTCDIGAFEVQGDKDRDGIEDVADNCTDKANRDQADSDGDGIGDLCDTCPNLNFRTAFQPQDGPLAEPDGDADGDGFRNQDDCCPGTASAEHLDDRGCSLFEKCPCEGRIEPSGKKCLKCGTEALAGTRDKKTPCLRPWQSRAQFLRCARGVVHHISDHADRRQARRELRTATSTWNNRCGARGPKPGIQDSSGVPNSELNDQDFDCISDAADNCLHRFNPGQKNSDPFQDDKGNACDVDPDGDGLIGGNDNCPLDYNLDQSDADHDGVGDECDECPETRKDADVDSGGCSPLQRLLKNKGG